MTIIIWRACMTFDITRPALEALAVGTAAADAADPCADSPPSPWPVFGGTCIATFLVSLDTTVLFAAFDALYLWHGALALLTGPLCLPVDTKPRGAPP
jgi:hypothetical protein